MFWYFGTSFDSCHLHVAMLFVVYCSVFERFEIVHVVNQYMHDFCFNSIHFQSWFIHQMYQFQQMIIFGRWFKRESSDVLLFSTDFDPPSRVRAGWNRPRLHRGPQTGTVVAIGCCRTRKRFECELLPPARSRAKWFMANTRVRFWDHLRFVPSCRNFLRDRSSLGSVCVRWRSFDWTSA